MSQNKLIIGKRNHDADHHWQNLDLNSKEPIIKRATVLVLGGNNTKSEQSANGNAKFIENLLGNVNDQVDIISVGYSQISSDTKNINNQLFPDAKLLEEKLFAPLVSKNNCRLDIGTAIKNTRRLNIFTHCAGSNCFNLIIDQFINRLNSLNYSAGEIKEILNQLFVLSYAPLEPTKEGFVKSMYINSTKDNQLGIKAYENIIGTLRNSFKYNPADLANLTPAEKATLTTKEQKHYNRLIKAFPDELQLSPKQSFLYNKNKIDQSLQQYGVVGILSKNTNELAYLTSQQAEFDENMDNHVLNFVTRDQQFHRPKYSSKSGDIISVCMADALLNYVSNSIVNDHSAQFTEVGKLLIHTQEMCNNIIMQMQQNELGNC